MHPDTTDERENGRRTSAAHLLIALVLAAFALTAVACGSDDEGGGSGPNIAGTYTHPEEGTIVLEDGGDGTITQSDEPTPFTWTLDGDTVAISIDGEVHAQARVTDEGLTFRAGDFSGDEPVTFARS